MNKEHLTDEEISHPLNESLLQEAESVNRDRQSLQERLKKLEETRDAVSDAVYRRVLSDYSAKLRQTTERLLNLKKGLEEQSRALSEKKSAVQENMQFHRERIEESALRHALGEFTAEQHQNLTEEGQKENERLEKALKKLNEDLTRHQRLFEGLQVESAPTPLRRPAPPPSKPAPVREESLSSTEHTSRFHVEENTQGKAEIKVAELLVLEGGKVSQTVSIDHPILIGRSPANDVVLKEAKVSRKHAEIQCLNGKYVLIDLESSNGTYVQGKKISEYTLQPDDEIVIGNTKMMFKM